MNTTDTTKALKGDKPIPHLKPSKLLCLIDPFYRKAVIQLNKDIDFVNRLKEQTNVKN
jgi:hypothetical protein